MWGRELALLWPFMRTWKAIKAPPLDPGLIAFLETSSPSSPSPAAPVLGLHRGGRAKTVSACLLAFAFLVIFVTSALLTPVCAVHIVYCFPSPEPCEVGTAVITPLLRWWLSDANPRSRVWKRWPRLTQLSRTQKALPPTLSQWGSNAHGGSPGYCTRHTHLTELPGSFVKDLILCVGADGQVTTFPPPLGCAFTLSGCCWAIPMVRCSGSPNAGHLFKLTRV